MSTSVTIRANKTAMVAYEYPYTHFETPALAISDLNHNYDVLTGFEPLTGANAYKQVLSAMLYVRLGGSSQAVGVSAHTLSDEWAANTVTYDTAPLAAGELTPFEWSAISGWACCRPEAIDKLLRYGTKLNISSIQSTYTANSSSKPYLELELGESTYLSFKRMTPEAGKYISKADPLTFGAVLKSARTPSAATPSVASWKFRWKYADEETYTEVSGSAANGMELAYTMPANTLTRSVAIKYQWTVTDSTGHTEVSAWVQLELARLTVYSHSLSEGAFVARTKSTGISYIGYTSNPPINGSIEISQAELQWRALGETGTYSSIPFPEGKTLLVVPANTFPAVGFQMRIVALDTNGWENAIEWRSISTTDAISDAECRQPVNDVVPGNQPTRLEWLHIISSGTEPAGADVQYSQDGAAWTDLTHVTGSDSFCEIPADTFPAGTVYWRVRTYNYDDVPGNWAEAASFINFAAPAAPSVAVSASPLPLISWQSADQQAYRVVVDTYDSGPIFGTDKQFRLPEILPDGEHTAQVTVQNRCSLWSEWGAASFTVANPYGESIILSAQASHVAELSWDTEGDYESYRIYRNDELIAETQNMTYTDIYALGLCEYKVIGIKADMSYQRSSSVNILVHINCSMLCDLESGEWMRLEFSESSSSMERFRRTRTAAIVHYAGSKFPCIEYSEYYDELGSYEVLFWEDAEAARFRELLGKTVLLKSRGGWVVKGGLVSMTESVSDFYTSFSFALQQIGDDG